MAKPGHAYPLAELKTVGGGDLDVNHANNLMPGNHWQMFSRQIAFDHMEIGPADGAATDFETNLVCPREGIGHVGRDERRVLDRRDRFENHRFHGGFSLFWLFSLCLYRTRHAVIRTRHASEGRKSFPSLALHWYGGVRQNDIIVRL